MNETKTWHWRWRHGYDHETPDAGEAHRLRAPEQKVTQTPAVVVDEEPPLETEGDKVAEASWESFPASDPPGSHSIT